MSSKYEAMRPFIIDIVVLEKDTLVFEINAKDGEIVDYEVLCIDTETGVYEAFTGEYIHTFKETGKYRFFFRGSIPGLALRDEFERVDGKEECVYKYYISDVRQWGDIQWRNMDEMFYGCEKFNISAKDVPNLKYVRSMARMFCGAKAMNAPMDEWDVSHVTDMSDMFKGAKAFNQPLGRWNVSHVIDMSGMFRGAEAFNQPLERWDVSHVMDMSGMFSGTEAFNQSLEAWDVSEVTDVEGMFSKAWPNWYGKSRNMRPFVIEVVVTKKDTNVVFEVKEKMNTQVSYEAKCERGYELYVGDFEHKYRQCGAFEISFRGNISSILIRNGNGYYVSKVYQWGDICWKSMETMFKGCDKIEILAEDVPNLSGVKSLREMFCGCEKISGNEFFEKWIVSNVTNMSGMFKGASAFNQPLKKWNVSNVTDMSGMFKGASAFNQPLEKWNVSNVTNMNCMFYKASSFNKPLEKWDVSNVTNMSGMFYEASSFNKPLEKWDVSHVTDMSYMFYGASLFNKPLEKWDVSSVTDMSGMFRGASSFNQTLENWDVPRVLDSDFMFYADLNAIEMEYMFDGAEALVHKPSWYEE